MKKRMLFAVICMSLLFLASATISSAGIKQGGKMVVTYKDDISTLDPAIGYDWQNWSMIKSLFDVTKGEAFVASDVGQHQMWAAQYYNFDKPRRWLNSGGLGTMGFGLPAAIGAQFGNPDAQVACVTGDGSIQMCIQELSTCLQYNLPIKILCLNNRYLGMVRQWQEFFYERRYSHTYMDSLPDFVKLAESYGHVGMRVEQPDQLDSAIEEAFSMNDRLVFMDIITDQSENVFPMIPAGAGHSEMVLRPATSPEPR